jgi:hypothetical protein
MGPSGSLKFGLIPLSFGSFTCRPYFRIATTKITENKNEAQKELLAALLGLNNEWGAGSLSSNRAISSAFRTTTSVSDHANESSAFLILEGLLRITVVTRPIVGSDFGYRRRSAPQRSQPNIKSGLISHFVSCSVIRPSEGGSGRHLPRAFSGQSIRDFSSRVGHHG